MKKLSELSLADLFAMQEDRIKGSTDTPNSSVISGEQFFYILKEIQRRIDNIDFTK